MKEIKITKTDQSRLPEVNFDDIPFGRMFSDHMFVADYQDGSWKDLRIVPFGKMSIHPAMMALHYGQSIFEGMKASVNLDTGNPLLFRPEEHAKRLNQSAGRMCMPEFPEEQFMEALHQLISIDKDWIPDREGSALYIRPIMFATDAHIGVTTSKTYRFMIFTLPVGPYYNKAVSLRAEDKYVRAVRGGVGEAKTCGNYAASLYPAKRAQEMGYDQVMWTDAHEFKYIQEVGTMNIFFVIDGTVLTPIAEGAILKGITRDSILTYLRDEGIPVEERKISIDEVEEAYAKGKLSEVFGSGTAAVIAHVNKIGMHGKDLTLDPDEWEISIKAKQYINGLRNGSISDQYGWIVPVKERVLA